MRKVRPSLQSIHSISRLVDSRPDLEADWPVASSELHVFRGHQPSPTGFIMGHEFTGTVTEMGSSIKTVKKGDKIVAPFTICWYAIDTKIIYEHPLIMSP